MQLIDLHHFQQCYNTAKNIKWTVAFAEIVE